MDDKIQKMIEETATDMDARLTDKGITALSAIRMERPDKKSWLAVVSVNGTARKAEAPTFIEAVLAAIHGEEAE